MDILLVWYFGKVFGDLQKYGLQIWLCIRYKKVWGIDDDNSKQRKKIGL